MNRKLTICAIMIGGLLLLIACIKNKKDLQLKENTELPVVEDVSVDSITLHCKGLVKSTGAVIIERGFCWNTTGFPNINCSHKKSIDNKETFDVVITGLIPGKKYFIRAYSKTVTGKLGYGKVWIYEPKIETYMVSDTDGNKYNTVAIDKQEWLLENLKVTHYQNGVEIRKVLDQDTWPKMKTGAYCYYGGNFDNVKDYGMLYNYYTINDSQGLCPKGWHVPTFKEWNILVVENFDGQYQSAEHLKEKGKQHWIDNKYGDNISGFTALPGGQRNEIGSFKFIGTRGYWWIMNKSNVTDSTQVEEMETESRGVLGLYKKKVYGISVRCIKD